MIPKIVIEDFEEVYIEHVCDVLRFTREELQNKLDDNSNTGLNRKAERFISTYLMNNTDDLTADNWYAAKELFVQWKLFEGIELERESEDKKQTLFELLDLFKQNIIKHDKEDNKSRYAKVVVVHHDK